MILLETNKGNIEVELIYMNNHHWRATAIRDDISGVGYGSNINACLDDLARNINK